MSVRLSLFGIAAITSMVVQCLALAGSPGEVGNPNWQPPLPTSMSATASTCAAPRVPMGLRGGLEAHKWRLDRAFYVITTQQDWTSSEEDTQLVVRLAWVTGTLRKIAFAEAATVGHSSVEADVGRSHIETTNLFNWPKDHARLLAVVGRLELARGEPVKAVKTMLDAISILRWTLRTIPWSLQNLQQQDQHMAEVCQIIEDTRYDKEFYDQIAVMLPQVAPMPTIERLVRVEVEAFEQAHHKSPPEKFLAAYKEGGVDVSLDEMYDVKGLESKAEAYYVRMVNWLRNGPATALKTAEPEMPIGREATNAFYSCRPLLICREISQARVAVASVAVAIQRYRVRFGGLPENLRELVATGMLERLPQDPFAQEGEVIRYSRTDTGCTLHSVGPDGRDDRGQAMPAITQPAAVFAQPGGVPRGDIVVRIQLPNGGTVRGANESKRSQSATRHNELGDAP